MQLTRRQLAQFVVSAAVASTLSVSCPESAKAKLARGAASIFSGYYPSGHWVDPTVAGFSWASGGGYQAAFSIFPQTNGVANAYARQFWMYYDGATNFVNRIPIIARGGAFPYVYQIIQAPANSGARMGASIWQPGWTIADAVAAGYGDLLVEPTGTFTNGTFQVRVFDQTGAYLDFTWTASTVGGYSYNATTPANSFGFVFLDPAGGVDPGSYPSTTGLISTATVSAPMKTLNWAFSSTIGGQTYPNAILVVRGTGVTPTWAQGPSAGITLYKNFSPMSIIGIPNDPTGTPTIDSTVAGSTSAFQSVFADVFLYDFTHTVATQGAGGNTSTNWKYYVNGGAGGRWTAGNLAFPNVFVGSAPTDNAGPFEFSNTGGAYRQYIGMKGITQTNLQNVGSNSFSLIALFTSQYVCVELCQATGTAGYGMSLKDSIADVTVRATYVQMTGAGFIPCNYECFWDGLPNDNVEICYCIFDASNGTPPSGGTLRTNSSNSGGTPAGQQAFGPTYFFRNAVLGTMNVNDMATPVQNGPWSSTNDAIQYSTATQGIYYNGAVGSFPPGMTASGLVQASSGIFNNPAVGDYSFAPAYLAHAGLAGPVIL